MSVLRGVAWTFVDGADGFCVLRGVMIVVSRVHVVVVWWWCACVRVCVSVCCHSIQFEFATTPPPPVSGVSHSVELMPGLLSMDWVMSDTAVTITVTAEIAAWYVCDAV